MGNLKTSIREGKTNMTILELLIPNNRIVINKNLARTIGLHEATIYGELVSRHHYFEERKALDKDGYFYNTVDDMENGTTLTKYQQSKAINKLMKLKLIDMTVKGCPPKRYFKINLDTDILLDVIQKTTIEYRRHLDDDY